MRRVSEPFRPDRPAVAEIAAGAVLAHDESAELLLLHHAEEDRWCFPKGHVEAGESLLEAAVREITEETGLKEFTVDQELGEVAYRFFDPRRDVNVFKTTVYFLAFTPDREAQPEGLFDEYAWLAPRAAFERVAYDTDRRMIEAAQVPLRTPNRVRHHYG